MERIKRVKLSSILTESKIESKKNSATRRLRVRLNVQGVTQRPSLDATEKDGATKYYVRKAGQFVYGRQNLHKGAFGVIPEELDGFESSADIPSFDVNPSCLPEWIELFLKQGKYYLQFEKFASGIGSKRISTKKFLSLEIPLPPVEEQKIIIANLKKYLHYQSMLAEEIAHQQALLKKIRQQILQEAVEGKLTADWRAQHPDVEPASELLARIQAEKEQLVKDKKISKTKLLPPISEEEKPFALPDGWTMLRIEHLLQYKKRGMMTGPFGTSLQKSEHQLSGIPVWGIESIKNGSFTFKNKIFVSKEKAKELSAFRAEAEDILISRSGTIDEICVIPKNTSDGLISTNLIRISLLVEIIEPQYFCYLFKGSIMILQQLKNMCSGSTRLFLNQNILKSLNFTIPPLPEQKAIVAKIEKLLALCDQLEHEISLNQGHAEQLMQAVLSEAFSKSLEQTEQPASSAASTTNPMPDRLFSKQPADQLTIFSLIRQAEQQGFSAEPASFPSSSL